MIAHPGSALLACEQKKNPGRCCVSATSCPVTMGLYQIVEALLLMTNAVAVLNEDRFLAPYGFGMIDMGSGRVSPFKGQLIGLIHAVQYLRVPLIVANSIVIVSKLLFG